MGAHNRVPSKQLYISSNWANHGFFRHLIIWKALHFQALTQILLSKVKGPTLPKERWRKGFVCFSLPKVGAHDRVPSKQLQLLNNIIVWTVLYCEHPLLGVKKNTKPFLHLSLGKAGPFTLESNICVKAVKCKVFQIIRCLIKPFL